MMNRGFRLPVLGRGGGKAAAEGISYLLRDQFITDASAPLASPRTCEPGPGTLDITDASNILSISSSRLVIGTGASAIFTSQQFTNIPIGTAVLCELIRNNNGNSNVGWSKAAGGDPAQGAANGFTTGIWYNGIRTEYPVAQNATGTTRYALVRMETGYHFLTRPTTAISWTMNFVTRGGLAATDRLGVRIDSATALRNITFLGVKSLPSPYNTDFGLAETYVANTGENYSAACSSKQHHVRLNWTPGSGQTLNIKTGYTDANNYYFIRCDQAASTLKIFQRIGGVETERKSVSQTWTAGTTYAISYTQNVAVDQCMISVYINNTKKTDWASYPNPFLNNGLGFATDLSVSNLEIYPSALSTAIGTTLDACFPF